MKTIYDRLNPEIKASIKKDQEKYPASTGHLIQTLKMCKYWTDLTMLDIHSVINHSHVSLIDISMKDVMWGDKFLTNGVNNNR